MLVSTAALRGAQPKLTKVGISLRATTPHAHTREPCSAAPLPTTESRVYSGRIAPAIVCLPPFMAFRIKIIGHCLACAGYDRRPVRECVRAPDATPPRALLALLRGAYLYRRIEALLTPLPPRRRRCTAALVCRARSRPATAWRRSRPSRRLSPLAPADRCRPR